MPKFSSWFYSLRILILYFIFCVHVSSEENQQKYFNMKFNKKDSNSERRDTNYLHKLHPFLKKYSLSENMKSLVRDRQNKNQRNFQFIHKLKNLENVDKLGHAIIFSRRRRRFLAPSVSTSGPVWPRFDGLLVESSSASTKNNEALFTTSPLKGDFKVMAELNNTEVSSKSVPSQQIFSLKLSTNLPELKIDEINSLNKLYDSSLKPVYKKYLPSLKDLYPRVKLKMENDVTTKSDVLQSVPNAAPLKDLDPRVKLKIENDVRTKSDVLQSVSPPPNAAPSCSDDDGDSKTAPTDVLGKILEGVNQLQEKSAGSSRNENFPCSINGSWISAAGGMRLDVTAENNILKVKTCNRVPKSPSKGGFLTTGDWNITGFVAFENTDVIILTALEERTKHVSSFIGECKVCGGNEMVSGEWLNGRVSSDCKDERTSFQMISDVWKREHLHTFLNFKPTHKKTTKKSKCKKVTKCPKRQKT